MEDPWNAPPEDAYAWSVAPTNAAAQPEEVVVRFDHGEPIVNGERGAEMVASLNVLAGKHGIGRIDMVEDRVVGLKSREKCTNVRQRYVLIAAHRALERLVLTRDELRFKAQADQKYAELVYDGLWMQPLRDALDAFNGAFAERMTGEVRMQLYRGNATIDGVRSPLGLYRENLATYGAGDAFDHAAASRLSRWPRCRSKHAPMQLQAVAP